MNNAHKNRFFEDVEWMIYISKNCFRMTDDEIVKLKEFCIKSFESAPDWWGHGDIMEKLLSFSYQIKWKKFGPNTNPAITKNELYQSNLMMCKVHDHTKLGFNFQLNNDQQGEMYTIFEQMCVNLNKSLYP